MISRIDLMSSLVQNTTTMACPHLDQVRSIKPPTVQSVHREECTLCFDGQVCVVLHRSIVDNGHWHSMKDSSTGVDVCLTCFNGGCVESERKHALLHYDKSHHPFTLNVKRKLKPNAQRVSCVLSTSLLFHCWRVCSLRARAKSHQWRWPSSQSPKSATRTSTSMYWLSNVGCATLQEERSFQMLCRIPRCVITHFFIIILSESIVVYTD